MESSFLHVEEVSSPKDDLAKGKKFLLPCNEPPLGRARTNGLWLCAKESEAPSRYTNGRLPEAKMGIPEAFAEIADGEEGIGYGCDNRRCGTVFLSCCVVTLCVAPV